MAKITFDQFKETLGEQFGEVKYTRKKKNPYLAISADGLNEAYGKTKEEALKNLIKGIETRENNSHNR